MHYATEEYRDSETIQTKEYNVTTLVAVFNAQYIDDDDKRTYLAVFTLLLFVYSTGNCQYPVIMQCNKALTLVLTVFKGCQR